MGSKEPASQSREPRSAVETLEERAREIAAGGRGSPTRASLSASSLIEEQIGLTLQHIDDLRDRSEHLKNVLSEAQCSVDTELMQMEQRTPRYSPYRYPEREKLQRRLGQLAEEGRRLLVAQAEKLDSFHDRLLMLLQRHRQLT